MSLLTSLIGGGGGGGAVDSVNGLTGVVVLDARATDAAANTGQATQRTFYYSPSGLWAHPAGAGHLVPVDVETA